MSATDSTRPSLLSRVRDPDDFHAWREFDRRYRPLIVRFALGRGLQLSDAEDVAQIVLMRLANSLRSFQYKPAMGRFRNYLGRSVQNEVARHRAPQRMEYLDSDASADIASGNDEAEKAWDDEWVQHHYRCAVETLRVTFDESSLNVFEQLLQGSSVQAVVASTGMSADAVYKAKQRVRARLKALIATQIHEEEFPERQSGTQRE